MRSGRFRKRNKMNASRAYVLDGRIVDRHENDPVIPGLMCFHSWGEADRYIQLLGQQAEGLISELRTQVKYPCIVNGVNVCAYIADFTYMKNGKLVVEDLKGFRTDIYILKRKLVEALYSIYIVETKPRRKPRK